MGKSEKPSAKAIEHAQRLILERAHRQIGENGVFDEKSVNEWMKRIKFARRDAKRDLEKGSKR